MQYRVFERLRAEREREEELEGLTPGHVVPECEKTLHAYVLLTYPDYFGKALNISQYHRRQNHRVSYTV